MKASLLRIGSEEGVTSIEYALLGALIAAVIAISVGIVGNAVQHLYDGVKDEIVLAIQ